MTKALLGLDPDTAAALNDELLGRLDALTSRAPAHHSNWNCQHTAEYKATLARAHLVHTHPKAGLLALFRVVAELQEFHGGPR